MFEIGASLREARERRRLGYDQVEAETKIRTKYVRCLEDEQFEVLPSGTYVKGFLRTYADYLGLDGQLYVDEYASRYGDGHDEIFPRRRERPQVQRRESSNAVLLALAGIVALFTLFVVAWRFGAEEPPPATPTPVVSQTSSTPEQPDTTVSIENAGLDEQVPNRNAKKPVVVKMKIVVGSEASWLVVSGSIGGRSSTRPCPRARCAASHRSEGLPDPRRRHADGGDRRGQRRALAARRQGAVARDHKRGHVVRRQGQRPRHGDGFRLTAWPPPVAGVLVTGSEILLGMTPGSQLGLAGARAGSPRHRAAAGPDRRRRAARRSRTACAQLAGCDLILTSGGLGPTHDDRTVAAVAAVAGVELALDEATLAMIDALTAEFARQRGLDPAHVSRGQPQTGDRPGRLRDPRARRHGARHAPGVGRERRGRAARPAARARGHVADRRGPRRRRGRARAGGRHGAPHPAGLRHARSPQWRTRFATPAETSAARSRRSARTGSRSRSRSARAPATSPPRTRSPTAWPRGSAAPSTRATSASSRCT